MHRVYTVCDASADDACTGFASKGRATSVPSAVHASSEDDDKQTADGACVPMGVLYTAARVYYHPWDHGGIHRLC